MSRSVVLGELPPATEALWVQILDLARLLPAASWLLVGGQMVMLHAFAACRPDGARASQDVDILADLLVSPDSWTTCSRVVTEGMGLRPEPDSHGRRYRHRHPGTGTVIDILCPDHRRPVTTGRTLSVEGGFQALERRSTIDVRLREADTPWSVPVPDLLGAAVLKAAAAVVDSRDSERHVADLALLVSLMADPLAERSRLKGSDRSRLLRVGQRVDDPGATCWRRLGDRGLTVISVGGCWSPRPDDVHGLSSP